MVNPSGIALPPDTLHIWTAELNRQHDTSWQTLSPDEQARAARFIHETIRRRFIAARGMLRAVLSQYLNVPPDAIPFVYGQRGKPTVPGTRLSFNLSHSENLALLGIVSAREIGVDVEQRRSIPEMPTMARDYFSPLEQTTLFDFPPEQRDEAFLACWTRKEAYIKAVGEGFALPLRDFDVSLASDVPPRFLRIKDDDPSRWTLIHLEPAPGYIGAACVERLPQAASIEYFHFG